VSLIVDAVDDAVGAAARAVPVRKRWAEPLAHTLWVGKQGADDLTDELAFREGQSIGQL
jgi:hypothetical protein